METSITEAELAENVRDFVDRVCRGEQFIVVRDGEAVAVLSKARPKLSDAVQEVAEKLKNLASPDDSPALNPGTAP